MPAMITPRMRQRPPEGQPWAADNGRYASPEDYTDASYLAWLARMPAESCLFATAPDVVGDARATWEMSEPMLGSIRRLGYPVALVAQDGMEEPIAWDRFDVLFIGGSTEWKLGHEARSIGAQTKRMGKWLHMGRVNTLGRVRYAHAIGCDSVDGTLLAFNPAARVRQWMAEVNAQKGMAL